MSVAFKNMAKSVKTRRRKSGALLQQARRRARLAELAAGGLDLRQCEAQMRDEGFAHVDHATLGRDLKRERQALNQSTRETVNQHRELVLKKLLALEVAVRERGNLKWGKDPQYVGDLLSIFDRLAKLLGLNAADQIHVSVGETDPERMGLYHRFVHETRWVREEEFPGIWEFCQKLGKPPTAETSARCLPKPDEDDAVN